MIFEAMRYNPGENYLQDPPFFESSFVIDAFDSAVWCRRFDIPGDFVLKLPAVKAVFDFFMSNTVLIRRIDVDDGTAMLVSSLDLETSADGNYLTLRGESLEAILGRRVYWQKNTMTGHADAVIYEALRENILSDWYFNTDAQHLPNYKYRYINLLDIDEHAQMGGVDTSVQPYGRNLLELVEELAQANDFGFRIRFDGRKMHFSCYRGTDRTMQQHAVQQIIFSPEFAEFSKTRYTYDLAPYFNCALIGGEGQGESRKDTSFESASRRNAGLLDVETFVDAKNISADSEGISPGSAAYTTLLGNMGADAVNAAKAEQSFETELAWSQWKYRDDYDVGDIVTVENGFGISGDAVVAEVAETEDANGYYAVPAFRIRKIYAQGT